MINKVVLIFFILFLHVCLRTSTCDQKLNETSAKKSKKDSSEDEGETVMSTTIKTADEDLENRAILGSSVPKNCENANKRYDNKNRMCRLVTKS